MRIRMPGLYIALGLVLAGLIHIVAVLLLPMVAPRNAYARLIGLGPVNTVIQLPAAEPGRQVCPVVNGPDPPVWAKVSPSPTLASTAWIGYRPFTCASRRRSPTIFG